MGDDIVRTCRNRNCKIHKIKNLWDNTVYEGDISDKGDKVVIRTRPDVTIYDYVKGMDLSKVRQTPELANVELTIDYAKGYSVMIDDIDKIQNDINAMDEWAMDGSEQLGIAIDRTILRGPSSEPSTDGLAKYAHSKNCGATAGAITAGYNLGTSSSPIKLTRSNILNMIAVADAVLTEQNVPETDRWMIIPAWAKMLINTSDLRSALFTGDQSNKVLRNGRMGMISNFTLYASNNLGVSSTTYWQIPFGHKSALCFASQLVKNRILELQNTWGTAMEGLHVFGYKVLKPESLGYIYADKDLDA